MPLIDGVIPNFVQGVSQQAGAFRLPSPLELQENCQPSLVGTFACYSCQANAILAQLVV